MWTNRVFNPEITEKLETLKALAPSIPGVVVIHNIQKFELVYMSPYGTDELDTPLEEFEGMHMDEYNRRHLNLEDALDYVPKVAGMLQRNNNDETITFFQQVRRNADAPWKWYISSIKIFARDAQGQPLLTINTAAEVDAKHYLTNKIERLLRENNFLRKNGHLFAELTKREKEVLRLMALGKSAREIAEEIFISANTIETHRRNIKRKLNISTSYEIAEYARAFDLI